MTNALINDSFGITAVLVTVPALIFTLTSSPKFAKFFNIIPPLVFAYFIPTILSNANVIPSSDPTYSYIKSYILPASLLLLTLSVDIKHTPNRGSDMHGWGIFQLTNPVPTHTDLWNWKSNIDRGKEILSNKKKLAQDYFDAVKRTFPKKYETPPQNYTVHGTDIKLTALEAATIQLYNGGAVEKSLKNREGTFSPFVSCWEFLPDNPSGQKWKFIQNRNNYVKKVVLAYEDLNNKK